MTENWVSKSNRKSLGHNPPAGSTVRIWGAALWDSDIPNKGHFHHLSFYGF